MTKNKWGLELPPQTICAIDASTNSLAFALFDTQQTALGTVGKINFEGKDIYEKIMDAGKKVKAFFDFYGGFEAIIIEHTVFMNSPKTAADLALVQGSILGAAGQSGTKIIGKVSPITWQNYIGNKKNIKRRTVIYSFSESRQVRILVQIPMKEIFVKKEQLDLLILFTIGPLQIMIVADACGIGHWALK